ncbi:hypothetical protein CYME_CMR442C [Cyanidioschyzon merolae strain 10D]|jgi:hypothetical protein|uniref:Uncharacterized protein n=1 Tax=Cyanidioschyzon merolae (strain NIES-3377 / 10D) TaxID=280699 RepID=M1VH57_CYAM1|nr:hypothetical protein CYME_CMR442C [Cyanidioschyzon merolae strain 10D]BAM82617.1 hypothetical protein CYME_CMR442C [Cyanidioschyzon merolae strain 10D]|eukprot:XP_005538653.1 hypothetical protein CYME_CMR442C [Cyanidioschyzon merolae strain 10D]
MENLLRRAKLWNVPEGDEWRLETCPTCNGKGLIICPCCHGRGKCLSLVLFVNMDTPCLLCFGNPEVTCGNCEGNGKFVVTPDGRYWCKPPKYRRKPPPGVSSWNLFANIRFPTQELPPEVANAIRGLKFDVFGQVIKRTSE